MITLIADGINYMCTDVILYEVVAEIANGNGVVRYSQIWIYPGGYIAFTSIIRSILVSCSGRSSQ